MSQLDWNAWHLDYGTPNSPLFRRLQSVQRYVRTALDRCPAGQIRVLSMCAGQGHDLIDVLADHPRRDDVHARLVEFDARNVSAARDFAMAADLRGVEIVHADASLTDVYKSIVPSNLVLVCGVFGNISNDDIHHTIRSLPSLCAPGATVFWTRNLRAPDMTPVIRQWFLDAHFAELGFETAADTWGVGVSHLVGPPAAFRRGIRLFDFVGDDWLISQHSESNQAKGLSA